MLFRPTSTKTVQRLTRWVHWRFRPSQRNENMYRGIYATFSQAREAIGPSAGYDSAEGGGFYRDRLDKVFPEDYPLLFWLQPIIGGIRRVFDFGGHVGLHYYAFKKLLELPPALTWEVSDVPAVCSEGEVLAKSRGQSASLKFAPGFDLLDGADVCISSGALQYLDKDVLPNALKKCPKPPQHLLLNKLPVLDGPSFATVQDVWVFKSAYTVFGHRELISSYEAAGYRLKDEWKNPGHHCLFLGDPAHSVQQYSGFYFVRASA